MAPPHQAAAFSPAACAVALQAQARRARSARCSSCAAIAAIASPGSSRTRGRPRRVAAAGALAAAAAAAAAAAREAAAAAAAAARAPQQPRRLCREAVGQGRLASGPVWRAGAVCRLGRLGPVRSGLVAPAAAAGRHRGHASHHKAPEPTSLQQRQRHPSSSGPLRTLPAYQERTAQPLPHLSRGGRGECRIRADGLGACGQAALAPPLWPEGMHPAWGHGFTLFSRFEAQMLAAATAGPAGAGAATRRRRRHRRRRRRCCRCRAGHECGADCGGTRLGCGVLPSGCTSSLQLMSMNCCRCRELSIMMGPLMHQASWGQERPQERRRPRHAALGFCMELRFRGRANRSGLDRPSFALLAPSQPSAGVLAGSPRLGLHVPGAPLCAARQTAAREEAYQRAAAPRSRQLPSHRRRRRPCPWRAAPSRSRRLGP